MNCPFHHKLYANKPRGYRDLPVRFAEYGTCYRFEQSGELFGLMRVRGMQMNDAHIYCTEEQFEQEFMNVIQLYLKYFQIFGIDKYVMRLSKHAKEGLGKKYVDNEPMWIKTEDMVRRAMVNGNVPSSGPRTRPPSTGRRLMCRSTARSARNSRWPRTRSISPCRRAST